jgi:ABC-type bacteriocin/lantibiotic exporter with double-glycine peptidase domain
LRPPSHLRAGLGVLGAALLALPLWAGALWIDVPFVSQPPEGCGAAVISMVMQYWTKQAGHSPPETAEVARIQAALFSPKERGISNRAMRQYFQEHDYRAFEYRGDWSELGREVRLGRPPIVALAPDGPHAPLHYAVVVGIDPDHGYAFLNDPAQGKLLRASREAFEKTWKATDHWTLLAVPLPSS